MRTAGITETAFESNLSHVRERFTCYTAFWLLNAGIVRAAGASGTDTPKPGFSLDHRALPCYCMEKKSGNDEVEK